MSKHKITATRSGSHPTMGDWDAEYEITFEYRAGRPAVIYLRNGDPGYPADPDEIELISIKPGAGDPGGFSDLAQRDIEDWAQSWLDAEGYDAALAIVAYDRERDREYATERQA